ncbi:response regulator transcription factor [Neobacillus cucumis]|uniref:response regulator transcription factor n=1 Tax=Neobacillus cucumis TaxID=1740721 RepID=UPI0019664660|nr:response regulator [Neobacillus cucumis]MBM7654967.1 YesN/AraC family two-component response regulator [Neobacillus cucumis]
MLNEKTILIVDDEPRTLQGLKRTLDKWANGEFNVLTASSGEEAIELMHNQKVHILISDIQMPEISGLQLLKRIKEHMISPVIIMVSAYSEFQYAQEALRLGVINYLLKPIGKNNLIEAVEEAVQVVAKKERMGIIERVVDNKLIDINKQSSTAHETIREAMAFINHHLQDELTLKEVAEYVHLNPSYFSVLFKEHAKVTFSEYVTRRRIQRAKELLIATNLPIAEIAEEAGYKTAKYFIKIFKELGGVTPSSFRKNNVEKNLAKY